MNPKVFRDYDIRGIVARGFDDAFVKDLSRAMFERRLRELGAI